MMDTKLFLETFLPQQAKARCLRGNQLSKVVICIQINLDIDKEQIISSLVGCGYKFMVRDGIEYINVNPVDIDDAMYLRVKLHRSISSERMYRIMVKRPLFELLLDM